MIKGILRFELSPRHVWGTFTLHWDIESSRCRRTIVNTYCDMGFGHRSYLVSCSCECCAVSLQATRFALCHA